MSNNTSNQTIEILRKMGVENIQGIASIVGIIAFLGTFIGAFVIALTKFVSNKNKIQEIEDNLADDLSLLTNVKKKLIENEKEWLPISNALLWVSGLLLLILIFNSIQVLNGNEIDLLKYVKFIFFGFILSALSRLLQLTVNIDRLRTRCNFSHIDQFSNIKQIKADLRRINVIWGSLENDTLQKKLLNLMVDKIEDNFTKKD